MTVRRREHRYDDDEDPDAPLASDQDPSDMLDVIDCPYCGNSISDMAQQCPKCGNYLSREDMPVTPTSQTRRIVTAIVVVVLLLSFAMSLLR